MGKSIPSCSLNALFAHTLSTLMPNTCVLVALNLPAFSRYRESSVVQPGEKAAGKNASTTFCFPLKLLSVTSLRAYLPSSWPR